LWEVEAGTRTAVLVLEKGEGKKAVVLAGFLRGVWEVSPVQEGGHQVGGKIPELGQVGKKEV
jgi:hypothetical protein